MEGRSACVGFQCPSGEFCDTTTNTCCPNQSNSIPLPDLLTLCSHIFTLTIWISDGRWVTIFGLQTSLRCVRTTDCRLVRASEEFVQRTTSASMDPAAHSALVRSSFFPTKTCRTHQRHFVHSAAYTNAAYKSQGLL